MGSLALLCLVSLGYALQQRSPTYRVYAIRYATIPGFQYPILVAGADRSRKIDIAMMVWLVKGNGHNILVDSGFYREHLLQQWKRWIS